MKFNIMVDFIFISALHVLLICVGSVVNEGPFYCYSSNRFIPYSYVCDGDTDCLYAEDETECGTEQQANAFVEIEATSSSTEKSFWLSSVSPHPPNRIPLGSFIKKAREGVGNHRIKDYTVMKTWSGSGIPIPKYSEENITNHLPENFNGFFYSESIKVNPSGILAAMAVVTTFSIVI